MDTQTLKKHHFWILLTLAVILIPVALGGAVFGVGKAAKQKRSEIDKMLKDLQSASPKSQSYLAKLDEQKETLTKQRDVVWQKAYETQAGLIHWPEKLKYLDSKYFGDPIPETDRTIYMNRDVYLAEYEELPALIEPTLFIGGSWQSILRYVPEWSVLPSSEEAWLSLEDLCVQRELLRDVQAIDLMLGRFLKSPLPVSVAAPTPPAALAEGASPEDQERYQKAKEEFDKAKAEFDKAKTDYEQQKAAVEKDLKETLKPKADEAVGQFISPYWKLNLAVARGPRGGEHIFRGRLTNVSPRRQNVSKIVFRVWLGKPGSVPPLEVPVEYEYLEAGQSFDFNDVKAVGNSPSPLAIQAVEQKLDIRFAPVKRIDVMNLAYPSNRFANQQFKASAFSQKAIEAEGQAAGGAPGEAGPGGAPGVGEAGGPGGPGGDMRKMMSMMGGPGGGMGGMATNSNMTPNGVERLRYLDRTDQVRHMAIGLVLVVDQAHIQDVLRAFANSRLRFQTTQYHWTRFHGTFGAEGGGSFGGGMGPGGAGRMEPGGGALGAVRPGMGGGGSRPSPSRPGGPGGGVPIPGGGPGGLGGRRFGAPPRGEGGIPGGGPRGGFPPFGGGGLLEGSPMAEEMSANLVELSIYGLISLYEKFPPRPPEATPEGGAPASGDAGSSGSTPAAPGK